MVDIRNCGPGVGTAMRGKIECYNGEDVLEKKVVTELLFSIIFLSLLYISILYRVECIIC